MDNGPPAHVSRCNIVQCRVYLQRRQHGQQHLLTMLHSSLNELRLMLLVFFWGKSCSMTKTTYKDYIIVSIVHIKTHRKSV